MKLSIVTDEVSSDTETALEIIASWGVKFVEIRGVGDQRFPEVADYWHYRLPQLVREFGVSVAAISPGLFRTIPPGHVEPPISFTRAGDMSRVRQRLEAERLRDHHIEKLLPASIEAAQQLGATTIICFTFGRLDHTEGDLVDEEVIQVMRHVAESVASAGLTPTALRAANWHVGRTSRPGDSIDPRGSNRRLQEVADSFFDHVHTLHACEIERCRLRNKTLQTASR
jgi:sugar phosphate isomerase/epimerase